MIEFLDNELEILNLENETLVKENQKLTELKDEQLSETMNSYYEKFYPEETVK